MLLLLALEDLIECARVLSRVNLVGRLNQVLGESRVLLIIGSSSTLDFLLRAAFSKHYLTCRFFLVVGIEA